LDSQGITKSEVSVLLPTIADLFPKSQCRCSMEVTTCLPAARRSAERQEPYINQVLAYHALALLTRLLRHGYVSYHGGFVNLATGNMARCLWIGTLEQGGGKPPKKPPVFTASSSREAIHLDRAK